MIAGRDVLMRIELAEDRSTVNGLLDGDALRSEPIVVAADGGLHARPAAMITAAVRRFSADVRLTTGAREANARSVVSIMALELGEGDSVSIVARGPDAAAALAMVSELLAAGSANGEGARTAAPRAQPVAAAPARPSTTDVLRGVSASPGVAIGNVFQFRHDDVVLVERAADP